MESANQLPSEPRPPRRRPKVAPPTVNGLSAPVLQVPSAAILPASSGRKRPSVATGPVVLNTIPNVELAAEEPNRKEIVQEAQLEKPLLKTDDCTTLYDPCTGQELQKIDPISGMTNYDIKQLEKRIREIKRLRNETPISLYNVNSSTSNYDFLMNVFCDKSISLDDMVSFKLEKDRYKGADIYEVLSRLFVIFGGVETVNVLNGDYKIMLRIEDPSSIFDDLKTALQTMKCKATSKMGVSDITLIKTKTTKKEVKPDSPYCEIDCDMTEPTEIKTYLMSVKWYQKEKSAEHYDLEKLYIAGDNLVTDEKRPFGLIVFLKSKDDYKKAHSRASRQYTQDLAKTFFGWDEDVKPFLEDIRKTLFQNADILQKTPQELMLSQYFIPSAKPILSLQLHQDIIVTGINDLFVSNPYNDNRYVIGVLPRGGKTYIAGGIIREFINRNNFNDSTNINILWITAAPNETRTQVGNDLILKFQDFDSFNFVDIKNLTDFSQKRPKKHTVWFCSIQLLTATQAGRAKERIFLTTLLDGSNSTNKVNMIFFDEAHAGGVGDKNKPIIDKLTTTYSNIPFIFLTATYLNVVFGYKILKPNLFVWDYTDILKTRAIATESEREIAVENLKLRFGPELVTTIINKRLANTDSYEAMGKPYLDFPELYFISTDFNKEAKERFTSQDVYNPNKGFSFGTMFGLKADFKSFKIKTPEGKIRKDAYKIFNNIEHPRTLISLLTPSDPTQTFDFDAPGGEPFTVDDIYEQTLLKRIERLSYKTGSRFRIDEYPTLLMFLPTKGVGTDIYKLLPAFASLLMSHQWWNTRYEVACVISDDEKATQSDEVEMTASAPNIRILDDNIKSSILSYERELQCRPDKKGLIILAGDRLGMGISLPCTDCVFLFNETKSPDSIIQKMYRALTPSINKKSSFVIDLNPLRTLSAVYGYTRAAYQKAVTKSNIIDIIYDIYSWDEDIIDFQLEKGGSKRIDSSQERLSDMLELASKDEEFKDTFKNIYNFEKQLKTNITKKVGELGLIPVLKNMVIGKIQTKTGIKYADKANMIIKNGKLVLVLQKEDSLDNGEGENEENEENEEKEVEEVVIIDNFVEVITDFIKYLAMTSQEPDLDSAITEFESNVINNSGKSLQTNVIELLKVRGLIKPYIISPVFEKGIHKNPINNDTIISILIDVIKKYSPVTSSEIFRQMRSKIDEPSTRKNEVLKIIHKHLTPKKSQKESHGEVFTPIEIIENMLNHLPKSIWSNPDLKFLDPANGIGNFPIIAFYKLNEGLKKVIPNEEKRKKHIIENMLYMTEIQSNNTRIAKNIFSKLCTGCKPNIWTTDSLKLTSESLKKHGWPEKYDIIMSNPPFNSGGIVHGGGAPWPKFVYLAFNLIEPNGYITFIHPPGWRKFYDPEERDNQGKIWYTIRENGWHLEYINVSDKPPKHFPIVDYYVIKAGKSTKESEYDSLFMTLEDKGETTFVNDFIPNMINTDTQHIINKLFAIKGDDINVVYNQSFKPSKANEGKKGISHYHFTDRTGSKKYYNKPYTSVPDYINKSKVLMTFSGGYEKGKLFAFYTDEQMGTTNNSMYMLVKSKAEGEKVANFFNSDIITFLLKITQYSASPNHKNEFKILNQLKIPKSLDDYKLTASEESLIQKVVGAKEETTKGGSYNRFNKTRKNKNLNAE